MIYPILLILWVLGIFISRKICTKIECLCEENAVGLDEETLEEIKTQNELTKKHFYNSGRMFIITIIGGLLIPITEIRWILFFAGAFHVPMVFYEFFEHNIKKAFQSKEYLIFTLLSFYNLALMLITMLFYYFSYMHVDFTK